MQIPVNLPEGWRAVVGPGAIGFAAEGVSSWLAEALAAGETLHGWAARQPGHRAMTGRGTTWAVPAPAGGPGGGGWVVRHYHRGGAVARWLRDRYLAVGRPRPWLELGASLEVSRRGIPTPAVVAGAVYAAGAFYRADLVTAEIENGVDLAGVLFGGDRPARIAPHEALAAAGSLVRALAAAGVRHPDLNAGNIVLEARAAGPRAWLVDLDGCRFGPAGAGRGSGAMRRRLERSLRKLGARAGRPLAPDAWAALGDGTS